MSFYTETSVPTVEPSRSGLVDGSMSQSHSANCTDLRLI